MTVTRTGLVRPVTASYVAMYAENRGAGRTKLAEELSTHRDSSEGRPKRARLGGLEKTIALRPR